MERKINKKFIIIISMVIIALGIIILIFLVLNKQDNTKPNYNNPVPTPNNIVSNPVSPEPLPIPEDREFKIGYLYLDSGTPTGEVLRINLKNIDGLKETYSEYNAFAIENNKAGIAFLTSSEETTGERDSIPDNKLIIDDIYRVKSDGFIKNEFASNFSEIYSEFYYYTNNFKTNNNCSGEGMSCGGIAIYNSKIGKPFRIYCGIKTIESLDICDQVVKNMNITLSKL